MDSLQQLIALVCTNGPALSLLGITLAGLLLYWYGTSNERLMRKLNVPGPKPRMFVGNLPEVKKYGGMHLMVQNYIREYGKVFAICIGRKPSLVVSDPEMLKQIMVKNFANFRNRFSPGYVPSPLSRTLFASRDEDWTRIRHILTPTFSGAKMKQILPLIEECCDTLMKKLEEIAGTGKSVDLLNYFGKMTLEVILSAAFGVQEKIQTDPECEEILRIAKTFFRVPSYVRALRRLPIGTALFQFLAWLQGRRGYFSNLASSIITQRRHHVMTGRKDLLQLMLTAHEDTNAEGMRKLTDVEITAQCIAFLLAGYETSSNTLAVTAHNLITNPYVQDKLRKEIDDIFEANPDGNLYDLIQKIEYLDCVINESLRLSPPAFQTNRECFQTCEINDVHVPAGTEIIIPIYCIHRDPEAWPNPDKFNPERFRGPEKDARHPFQFMPFGSGPRNCIGMRFAQMEVKATLVRILRKFKLVQSPETQNPLPVIAGVTLTPRDGVFVRVETVH